MQSTDRHPVAASVGVMVKRTEILESRAVAECVLVLQHINNTIEYKIDLFSRRCISLGDSEVPRLSLSIIW